MYEFQLVYKVNDQVLTAYVYSSSIKLAKQWLYEDVPGVTNIFRCIKIQEIS